jgi:hypothetical protein
MSREKVTFGEVKIGPAHPARGYPDAHLAGTRNRIGALDQEKRVVVGGSRMLHHPGPHPVAAFRPSARA